LRWVTAGLWAVLSLGVLCPQLQASPLRVALATDPATLDPHSLNAGSTTLVLRQIYEPLVGRDANWGKAAALAIDWSRPEPMRWRFRLRAGVRFHEGGTFDADDVVFSINRARSGFSDFKVYTAGIVEVRKVEPLTVDVITDQPDPLLADKLTRVVIMDREWALMHGADQPQDFSKREPSHTMTTVNGTGPFRLRAREPGGRIDLVANADWWSSERSAIEEVAFLPIANDGPRIAALLAGDVDLVLDLPPQLVERVRADPRLRILEKPDNRTLYLGMDTARDELPGGSVKGANPLKDVRVRRALWRALDTAAIQSRLMNGHAVPTGLMWAPSVFGYAAEDDARPPFDREQAQKLLAEAGYRDGFDLTLDCSTDRYVADRQICQAVAAQLARIKVRVTVNPQPFGIFIAKLRRFETSLYLIGWAVPTFDALLTLQTLAHTPGPAGAGAGNFGRYSNPALDALIEQIKPEADAAKRLALIRDAGRIMREDVPYIPIHHQTIIWAMRADLDAIQPPENQLDVKWVTLRR
jgi:peptide/nickel transport system substrate-binding protein